MYDLHDVAAWVASSIAPEPGSMHVWDFNGHTRIDASRDRGGEGYLDPRRLPPDDGETAPGLEADNARRAAALAHHVELEITVIRGNATDEQVAEYAALQDAAWATHDRQIVRKPAPVLYGFDDDHDRPSLGATP
jgi:hypothetical protein